MTQNQDFQIKPDAITTDGSEVFIVDSLHPEATAMAQALYSRSPKSVVEHLQKIHEVGYEKFMDTFYVGYGHKSIGDCGSTTMFIENISMLAAKAIQDWQLYKGQEASTRYLDMASQKVLNPIEKMQVSEGFSQKDLEDQIELGKDIQDTWMNFYREVLDTLIPYFKEKYPKKEDEKEVVYEKAIKAKAFDISRGFLPAGATTYASWHTDLRQAHDHLKHLEHHTLLEIRELGSAIREALKTRYSSSFSHKSYDEQEAYYDLASSIDFYDRETNALSDGFFTSHNINLDGLSKYKNLLENRPVKTELPVKLAKYGSIRFSFPLDFGSFRDIQRHRNGICEMPLLSTKHGFFPWYLEQLTPELCQKAESVIKSQIEKIDRLKCEDSVKQYYIAMGFTIACEVTYSVPQTIYVSELRSSQTVHPTLRVIAQQMANYLKSIIPYTASYADMGPDEWDTKRGTQDIVKKS
jgi:thymidylate synthase ThyX